MKDTPDDWTGAQSMLFQRIYEFMVKNQPAFSHPQAKPVSPEYWETTCFNSAYAAAEFSTDCGILTIMSDDETVFASEKVGSLQ